MGRFLSGGFYFHLYRGFIINFVLFALGHAAYMAYFILQPGTVPWYYGFLGWIYNLGAALVFGLLYAGLVSGLNRLYKVFPFNIGLTLRLTLVLWLVVLLLLYAANIVYFDFFKSQINLRIVGQFGDLIAMPSLLEAGKYLLILPAALLLYILYKLVRNRNTERNHVNPYAGKKAAGVWLLLGIIVTVILIGIANGRRYYGYKRHPLQSNFLLQIVRESVESFKSIPKPDPKLWSMYLQGNRPDNSFNLRTLTPAPDRLVPLNQNLADDFKAGKVNIVFMALESFLSYESEHYGKDGLAFSGTSKMPFLDKLMAESLTVTEFYANGHQTVRGDVAALCSFLPNFGGQMVYYGYASNELDCLPELLKKKGFDTFWLSGFFKSFHNKQTFLLRHGMSAGELYDIETFPPGTEKTGDGISDRELYKKLIRLADKKDKNFAASLITYSTHYPFVLPQGYKLKTAGAGEFGKFEQTVVYSDEQLGAFFKKARKRPWFENTVFVFFGDHTMMWPYWKKLDPRTVSRITNGVVMGIYAPKYIKPAKLSVYGSHVDILPTLLDLLGVDTTIRGFGSSLLDKKLAQTRRTPFSFEKNLGLRHGDIYVNRYSGKWFISKLAGGKWQNLTDEAGAKFAGEQKLGKLPSAMGYVLETDALKTK